MGCRTHTFSPGWNFRHGTQRPGVRFNRLKAMLGAMLRALLTVYTDTWRRLGYPSSIALKFFWIAPQFEISMSVTRATLPVPGLLCYGPPNSPQFVTRLPLITSGLLENCVSPSNAATDSRLLPFNLCGRLRRFSEPKLPPSSSRVRRTASAEAEAIRGRETVKRVRCLVEPHHSLWIIWGERSWNPRLSKKNLYIFNPKMR